MVIAIDGPAGAGKSTVPRALARRLGFAYLDTGALYRCAVLAARRRGIPAAEAAAQMQVELGERIRLDGDDVTAAIRTDDVSQATSIASADPAVRAALLDRQRTFLATGDWVAEGRDIGTVIAPHAELKVFLTADLAERARRRAKDLDTTAEQVESSLQQRDERDQTREHGRLEPAPDAVHVDTTGRTIEQVVDELQRLAGTRAQRAAS